MQDQIEIGRARGRDGDELKEVAGMRPTLREDVVDDQASERVPDRGRQARGGARRS
jgi:hypothetical protein